MSSKQIESPPYPGQWVTADVLYSNLELLRDWVMVQGEELNEQADQKLIPEVREPQSRTEYCKRQPVSAHFMHLSMMRRVREIWDHLIREYEEAWDSKSCLQQRIVLVQNAALSLNNAFTPHEVREANAQAEIDRMKRIFEQTVEVLINVLEPKHREPPHPSDN